MERHIKYDLIQTITPKIRYIRKWLMCRFYAFEMEKAHFSLFKSMKENTIENT